MTNEKNPGGLIQIKKPEDVCPGKKSALDLSAVRERIDAATAHDSAEKTGPEYWRSLEELAGSQDFKEALHREFPKGASEWVDSVSRRGFLKVMGASLGLAGMTGCVRLPLEPIVPYVRQPEGVIPGRPMYYATATTLGGYASPLLVESHLGRPQKSKATTCTRPRSAAPTFLRRRQFSASTIPTAPRPSPPWATSAPGSRS
jgi:molybdopterin-containing oxidoreductase family iron-sulfur binding subunit